MHKADLIAALTTRTHLNHAKADAVVSAVIEQITNALSRQETVTITGFGTFQCTQRSARQGRNPQTLKPIEIAARRGVVFRPGKVFKNRINV